MTERKNNLKKRNLLYFQCTSYNTLSKNAGVSFFMCIAHSMSGKRLNRTVDYAVYSARKRHKSGEIGENPAYDPLLPNSNALGGSIQIGCRGLTTV